MGRDKALIEVGGVALAARVASCLRAAGADPVAAIGGRAGALALLGLVPVADDRPGDGPLAGLSTALAWAGPESMVLLAPCDLAHPDVRAFSGLLDALATDPTAPGAVAVADGQPQPTVAAWRVLPDLVAGLAERLDAGARRLDTATRLGGVLEVAVPAAAVADVDTPEDLARLDSATT